MKARRTLLTLALSLLLVASGLVVASNMAFNYEADFSVINKDYWVSLPYLNGYAQAQDVCGDLGPEISVVSRFDTPTGLRLDWTCPYGNNFALVPGEGLFLRVSAPSAPPIVGSHDPHLAIPLGGFNYVSRDWFLSVPYHTKAAIAHDICKEIGRLAVLVSRFDTELGLRQDWACPRGNNFAIRAGEAIAVRVDEVTPAFVPSHY